MKKKIKIPEWLCVKWLEKTSGVKALKRKLSGRKGWTAKELDKVSEAIAYNVEEDSQKLLFSIQEVIETIEPDFYEKSENW
jgi:hypothetical protein